MKTRNMTPAKKQREKQMTGNIGLFYVCFCLSRMGWNVLPTSRNAWGPDVLIYSQDAKQKFTIQVKSLAERKAAGFGTKLEKLVEDFVVVCNGVVKPDGNPDCFILKRDEVIEVFKKQDAKKRESKELENPDKQNKQDQYWLEPKDYDSDDFREKWNRIEQGN